MIEVRGLSVSYGDFSLEGIDLELGAGRCLAILGPSGAGKSLLLESVMGARRLRAGSVRLAGRNVTDLPPEERRIAYIPQDLALFPHLSVARNIVFGLESGRDRRRLDGPLQETAALLGITHLVGRPRVQSLSGGERQRVALARALIVKPRVLFLDEPFSALDPPTRAEMLRVVRDLRRTLDTAIFLVTHDLDEACLLSDEVAILIAGRIRHAGPTSEVLRAPGSIEVARFLNFRNILPRAALPPELLAGIPGLTADTVAVAIRPEDLRLEPSPVAPSGRVRARLLELVPLSGRTLARLQLRDGTPLEALLSHQGSGDLVPHLGRELALQSPPGAWVALREDPAPAAHPLPANVLEGASSRDRS